MGNRHNIMVALTLGGTLALAGCGGTVFKNSGDKSRQLANEIAQNDRERQSGYNPRQSTFLDLFTNSDDPNTTIEVNKYIWNAAQEVLNFMPIESADPFSGVLVYGYGRPPGGGRAYRATVYVQDPALDARSLNVALMTQSGPASVETVRAIEDAILTRARQLRVRDGKL